MASSIDDINATARFIRKLRSQQKMSQQQLATQAGVSFSFVNQVEGGKQTVRLDALNRILRVFGFEMAPQLIPTLAVQSIVFVSASRTTLQAPIDPLSGAAEDLKPTRQKEDWSFFK